MSVDENRAAPLQFTLEERAYLDSFNDYPDELDDFDDDFDEDFEEETENEWGVPYAEANEEAWLR